MKASPPSPTLAPRAAARKPGPRASRSRSRRRHLRFALRAVCWVAIAVGLALGLYLTLRQNSNLKDLWWMPRIVKHWVDASGWVRNVPAFALLAVPCLTIANGRRARRAAILWLAAFCAITEAAQYFIPGRWCEWQDVACGWAGLLLTWGLFEFSFRAAWRVREYLKKRARSRESKPSPPTLSVVTQTGKP